MMTYGTTTGKFFSEPAKRKLQHWEGLWELGEPRSQLAGPQSQRGGPQSQLGEPQSQLGGPQSQPGGVWIPLGRPLSKLQRWEGLRLIRVSLGASWEGLRAS